MAEHSAYVVPLVGRHAGGMTKLEGIIPLVVSTYIFPPLLVQIVDSSGKTGEKHPSVPLRTSGQILDEVESMAQKLEDAKLRVSSPERALRVRRNS